MPGPTHISVDGARHPGCGCGAGAAAAGAGDSIARNIGRMVGHIAAAISTPVTPAAGEPCGSAAASAGGAAAGGIAADGVVARRVQRCDAPGPAGTTLRRTVVDEIVAPGAASTSPRDHHAS